MQERLRLDGVDLRQVTLDGLRLRIALVAQDTYLFNDTLEANIRIARPGFIRARPPAGVGAGGIDGFCRQPAGGVTNARWRTRRSTFGGQRQRIAIARAFLKDAPILVLDEATSHLDTVSEERVRTALDALMVDRTTIVIAHRLSTIRAADMILVMDAGQVLESGTHSDLLARRGSYARLVERQMAGMQWQGAGLPQESPARVE